jgi:hypothetical protein
MLNVESTTRPQEIFVTHRLIDIPADASPTPPYGCIVVSAVGVGETIGETIGEGVMTVCAPAASVVAAPAIIAPVRTMPANHRFIDQTPFSALHCMCPRASRTRTVGGLTSGTKPHRAAARTKRRRANPRAGGGS